MDKVQFLVGLSMTMACFMDERGGQVGLSMKSGCFMDGWGIEEGGVHENGLFHGREREQMVKVSEGELLFVVGGGGVEGGGGVVAGDAVFGDEGGYVGVGVAVE